MSALRRFEHLAVTRVRVLEGEGIPEDPCREVNYYFDGSGALLWDDDKYGPAEYGRLSDFPGWALERIADALTGQTHNPPIRSLLNAIKAEQAKREIPA